MDSETLIIITEPPEEEILHQRKRLKILAVHLACIPNARQMFVK